MMTPYPKMSQVSMTPDDSWWPKMTPVEPPMITLIADTVSLTRPDLMMISHDVVASDDGEGQDQGEEEHHQRAGDEAEYWAGEGHQARSAPGPAQER